MKPLRFPPLSQEARNIVETDRRRIEVPARPGSGKTTTAIARIHHLTGQGVKPAEILVLSFSNDASAHFKEQLRAYGISGVKVSTCHALAFGLLNQHWRMLLFKKRPELLEGKAITQFMLSVINKMRKALKAKKDAKGEAKVKLRIKIAWLDHVAQPRVIGDVRELFAVAAVALAPLTGLTKKSSPRAFTMLEGRLEQAEKLRLTVQEAEIAAGRITFESMVRLATSLLKHPKTELQAYQHLVVDEYQDCSPLQVQFLAELARRIPKLMVFGDPLQSIYGFSGATYQKLGEALRGVRQLPLSKSYRLTQQNAAVANAIEVGATIRTTKKGPAPQLIRTPDATTQGRAVVRDICRLLEKGVDPADIVVLARVKAILGPIKKMLHARGSVTWQNGATQHWDDLRKLLRLIEAFERRRKKGKQISEPNIRKLLDFEADDEKWSAMTKEMRKITSDGLEARYKLCTRAYLRLCGGIQADKPLRNFLNEFQPLCRKFQSAAQMGKTVETMAGDAPVLFTTIHAAKGREWDHVFVVGATEGILPDHRADGAAALDEERRLLYVAVTRAKQSLQIYHAPTRIHNKKSKRFGKVSRFLKPALENDLLSFKVVEEVSLIDSR